MLLVGFNVQKDAILPEETFDPHTGETKRVDSGWKRWARGYRKQFARNTFDVLYALAALGTAGLGLWASIVAMEASFKDSPLTPFTCRNPADQTSSNSTSASTTLATATLATATS